MYQSLKLSFLFAVIPSVDLLPDSFVMGEEGGGGYLKVFIEREVFCYTCPFADCGV